MSVRTLLPSLVVSTLLAACELPVEPEMPIADEVSLQAAVEATWSDNAVGVQIGHITLYGTDGDLIPAEPVPMQNHFFWDISNRHDGSGADVLLERVTAVSDLGIVWSEGTPGPNGVNTWEIDQVMPPGLGFSAGGHVEPDIEVMPVATMTREVSPTRLVGPETVQTVRVVMTFLSVPEPGSTSGLNIGTLFELGGENLVESRVIAQYPVPSWEMHRGARVASWSTSAEQIQVGVPYEFVAEIRSLKSAALIGAPIWKAQVSTAIGPPPVDQWTEVGRVLTVLHPDGLEVTAETREVVEWHVAPTTGTELHFWPGLSEVEPCGESMWCVVPRVFRVPIEIRPGSSSKNINPKSEGKIPVAILSTAEFDAPAELVRESLRFGSTGYDESLSHCGEHGEDVDGDGRLDLVCHFETQLAGFGEGDRIGWLTGETIYGDQVWGGSLVRIVGDGNG